MKITKWVQLEAEVEVEVNVEEVMRGLCADVGDLRLVFSGLSNAAAFLKNISDEQIEAMTPEQRKCVFDALSEQSNRYSPGDPASDDLPLEQIV